MVQNLNRENRPTIVLALFESNSELANVSRSARDWGYDIEVIRDASDLLIRMREVRPSAVLVDLGPNHAGLTTVKELTTHFKSTPVIAMSSQVDVEVAMQAVRLGALDLIALPTDLQRLRKTLDRHHPRNRLLACKPRVEETRGAGNYRMLGQSQAMLDVLDLVNDVAESDATVLILGESGTGKELLARAIHSCSQRKRQSFVPVNVAALPSTIAESILFGHEKGAFTGADNATKGWCETANGGTLMLDEIGEMDILLQAKLLRFLQDGTFLRVGSCKAQHSDVRIIAATNREPELLIAENRMREDLYYRLNVFPIRMPPLRERREDIPLLATAFLDSASEVHRRHVAGFTPDAMHCLQQYNWPGNVRQLENLVTRMLLLTRESYIGISSVPQEIRSYVQQETLTEPDSEQLSQMEKVERHAIVEALRSTNYNAVAAAKLLGVGQATIYRKIKRFNIEMSRSRGHGTKSHKAKPSATNSYTW